MMQIDRMMGIVLVLIFMVAMGAFGYQMVNSAEASAGGKLQIENTQQMTQLVMYNSLIAYTCDDEKGGYSEGTQTVGDNIYWTDWEDYRDSVEIDWGPLEEAGSDLECYGSPTKLPLSDGFWGEVSPIGDDTWLNDQPGKYSRKDFVITEDDVELGPCIMHSDDPYHATYFIAGPGTSAVTTYRDGAVDWGETGPGYTSSHWCDTPNGFDEYQTDYGPVITVIAIDGDPDDTVNIDGWDNIDTSGLAGQTGGDENFDGHEYTLCEGTAGYIQTNVGPNDEETSGAGYSVEDTPGDEDTNVGSDDDANVIHPFIVFTNWEDDCY